MILSAVSWPTGNIAEVETKELFRDFRETHLTKTEWRNLFNSHFRARKSVVPVYLLFQQWARYSSATISRTNTGLHSATLFITHFYFLSYFQCVWEYHFFHIFWSSLCFLFIFHFVFSHSSLFFFPYFIYFFQCVWERPWFSPSPHRDIVQVSETGWCCAECIRGA